MKKAPKVIVLCNQKGGVAKTTTAQAIAEALAESNKVLVVDADPQANLTMAADPLFVGDHSKLYDVIGGNETIENTLHHTEFGFDLVSIGLDGAAADIELSGIMGREWLLRDAIAPIINNYDFVVIDTSPSLGILTTSALAIANLVVIPMNADIFSLQGVTQLSRHIKQVKDKLNPKLKVSGLLLTKYKSREILTSALNEALKDAAKMLDTRIFETKIRESASVRSSQALASSVYNASRPACGAAADYHDFFEEFTKQEKLK